MDNDDQIHVASDFGSSRAFCGARLLNRLYITMHNAHVGEVTCTACRETLLRRGWAWHPVRQQKGLT